MNKSYLNISQLKNLSPILFSYVMATEIVSIALYMQNYAFLSMCLHILGIVGYVFLVLLYGIKVCKYYKEAWKDLFDLSKGFEHFCIVAATNTLLVRFLYDSSSSTIIVLTILSLTLCIFLCYFIALNLFLFHRKSISESLSPTWLLYVIGIQSVSVLISGLIAKGMLVGELPNMLAYGSCGMGFILYCINMTFVLHRSFFNSISRNDLQPTYWMCMGAAAISILAGSKLALSSAAFTFILKQQVLIEAIVVQLWIWCTLWIPYLFIMEFYKYIILKQPIQYQTTLWSMVFPLGMYAVASDACLQLTTLSIIRSMTDYRLYLAFIAWSFVMLLYLNDLKKRSRFI